MDEAVMAVNSLASANKGWTSSIFAFDASSNNSSQKPDSSASSNTVLILDMKSACDLDLHAAR
jgi:hypothetical protein